MSDEQKAYREEAIQLAKMVAANLGTDPEVVFCQTVDKSTGQTAHANKVQVAMADGRQFTFSVSPVRTRSKGDTKSKK